MKELQENPNLNCLVFGWYIESIKDLQKVLQNSMLPNSNTRLGDEAVEIIYGETAPEKRPDILDGFNGVYEEESESKAKKKDYKICLIF